VLLDLWSHLEPAIMTLLDIDEKRHNPRRQLGRMATIKLGDGVPSRYVLVTNVSTDGVRLLLNGTEMIDEFVLLFHGNGGPASDGTYRLAWRKNNDAGAKFVSSVTHCA
jgi:hypothetical protein